MKQRFLILGLFAAATAGAGAGCSDDGGGGGSVTVEEFGKRASDASCSYEFKCCTDAERMMDFQIFNPPITTEAQCDTTYEGFIGAFLVAEWNDSIMKGRVSFDGHAAAGCLAVIEGLSCGQHATVDLQGMCQPYLTPLVDDGGACAQSYECKSNNCIGATSGNGSGSAAMDGSCMPTPTMGQACEDHCATGLYCDFSMGDTCQPTKADGMDCVNDDECTTGNCNSTTDQCGADAPRCTGA